jgi:hypothetical protein
MPRRTAADPPITDQISGTIASRATVANPTDRRVMHLECQ